jgi:hypothetical protein
MLVVSQYSKRKIDMLPSGLSCRVDIRPTQKSQFCEYVGRVHDLTSSRCSIRSPYQPQPGTVLELRLYLPGTDWPLAVNLAEVIWSHWDSFAVEFRDEQAASILTAYLAPCETDVASGISL